MDRSVWAEFRDARAALGWGIVFAGYFAYVLTVRWMRARRAAIDTRARLILSNAADPDRRARMIAAEMIEGNDD